PRGAGGPPNIAEDRRTLNAAGGGRSPRAIARRRSVSVAAGRYNVGATPGRRGGGGSRTGVRRAGTTARECRITATNCPAKAKLPPPHHSGRTPPPVIASAHPLPPP